MSDSVAIAIIGIITGLIGLLTAIANRKQVKEIRNVTITQSIQPIQPTIIKPIEKQWYDNHFYILIGILVFYPLGLYMLIQARTVNKFWKYVWGIFGFIFFIGIYGK